MTSSVLLQLVILLGVMMILMFLRFPAYLSMLGAVIAYIIVFPKKIQLFIVGQGIISGMSNQSFACICFYFLLGEIMNSTGLSDRLVRFAQALIGHVRGSLSHINILSSVIFAGVSGSSIADTASVGSLMIPMMTKEGYPAGYAAAVTQVSSSIGPIIPPSTGLILLAIYMSSSTRRFFLGGVIPGILMGVFEIAISIYISKKRNFPKTEWQGWKHVAECAKGGLGAFLLPVLIMVCLFFGIGTVIEIGAFSCLAAVIVSICYGDFTFKKFFKALMGAAKSAAGIMALLCTTGIFTWIISSMGISKWLAQQLLVFGTNPTVVMIWYIIAMFLLGMILDTVVLQMVIVPLLVPTVTALGIDPTWFAVVSVLVIQLGQNTPPVGCLIYATASIAKCTAGEVIKESLPYYAGLFVLVVLLCLCPALCTWLPTLLMG